ncbi:TetR/AcrR family transcriptional regulator [soil metagenome]
MPYRATAQTEARREATRERILASSRELIARGGYAGARVDAVAEHAEVAVGTVYRHFPSKADLLAAVFRESAAREVTAVRKAAGAETSLAETRIRNAVETFATRALRSRRLAFALLAEPVDPLVEAERLAFRRAYRDAFAEIIAAGVRSGELPDQDVELSAAALVGAIGEALVGPVSPTARDGEGRHLIDSITEFCIRSVTAREIQNVG